MKISEFIARFRRWQLTPVATASLNGTEQHVCHNCGESYDGRYCPRCGQTARTVRLTVRNVMSNALDVWGAGNRSMPRNIIHLLFRPGYMIADYLRGHRQPYFPPFKMLFIMMAMFLMIVHVSRWMVNYTEPENPTALERIAVSMDSIDAKDVSGVALQSFQMRKDMMNAVILQVKEWFDNHQAISLVVFQGFVAVSIWIVFRRSKRLPRLSLSEQVFVQVFLSSQILICSTIYFLLSLMWVHGGNDDLPQLLTTAIYLADYKQIFGFGWWGTFWRLVLAVVMLLTVGFLVLIGAVMLVAYPLIAENAV